MITDPLQQQLFDDLQPVYNPEFSAIKCRRSWQIVRALIDAGWQKEPQTPSIRKYADNSTFSNIEDSPMRNAPFAPLRPLERLRHRHTWLKWKEVEMITRAHDVFRGFRYSEPYIGQERMCWTCGLKQYK